jgi:hypothetical protein
LMSICKNRQFQPQTSPRLARRIADTEECPIRSVRSADHPRRSWHPLSMESWTRYRASPPLTGCAFCALAFSTLLSSQGADAHRHKAFAWIGGNPLTLPALSPPVKRFHPAVTARESVLCHQHTPYTHPPQAVCDAELRQLSPGPGHLPASRCSLGQDETLGSEAVPVKSSPSGLPSTARIGPDALCAGLSCQARQPGPPPGARN